MEDAYALTSPFFGVCSVFIPSCPYSLLPEDDFCRSISFLGMERSGDLIFIPSTSQNGACNSSPGTH